MPSVRTLVDPIPVHASLASLVMEKHAKVCVCGRLVRKQIKCQAPRENTASLFIQHRSAFVDLSHNPMKKGPNSTPGRVN